MQGCTRNADPVAFPLFVVGLFAVALAPAMAYADSFPEEASDYVSDHTGYFVAGLLAAILLLLLWSA